MGLGVGKLALRLGALGGELVGAGLPLRKAVIVLGLAGSQLRLAVGELSVTLVKAHSGGVELSLGVGEALLCGGFPGGKLGRGRVESLGYAGDLRFDLGDTVVELPDTGLGRGLLSLKVRLLRLERGKGALDLGELLLADGLLCLERSLLLCIALGHRVEGVELVLELRDRRGKRVDARLGLGDTGLDLGDSVIELLEPAACLVALLHKARARTHGVLIGRPAVVDLPLRLVEPRARLGTLLCQRRDPGLVLCPAVRKLSLTRRDGCPGGFKLLRRLVELGL